VIRGLYSAASGMFSLERKQEALSDNLANAQTPGYKKDDTMLRTFPKLMLNRINDMEQIGKGPQMPGSVPVGVLANGVYAQERVPSFAQGTLVQSDNPLDVAIEDSGVPTVEVNGRQVKPAAMFAVQLPDGTVGYTRNGKWDVDANGSVVTSEGYRVLGANNQPIQIRNGVGKENIAINPAGQIIEYPNDPARTRIGGQIGVAMVENPNDLRRMGGNVYQSDNPIPLGGANAGVSLQQGFIEQSNVDAGQTMTEMMLTLRGYEANQKVVSVYNTSLEQLYSVGKMN
jgi:flagellar basal-body rod protein FlgF